MKSQGIVTDLVGRRIVPRDLDTVGNYAGPWPVNDPNLNGEHFATITAVWEVDNTLKVLAVTPNGRTFETFVVNVNLVK